MPSIWKSIPPPLLCSFPPALWTDQGEGITLSLPRSKQDNKWFLSTDTPLPSRRKRVEKPSKPPQYGCVCWAQSANRGNSFHTWSLSYLREPWESAYTALEGGKKGGERAAASRPLLLINHQKSLPWFMAFDPSSSFALWRKELGGEKGGGTGRRVRVKAQRVWRSGERD